MKLANSRWQILIAAAILAAPACLAGFVLYSGALATRPLWLDESMTRLVANQKSLPAVIDLLRHGADTNPPLLFGWHWVIGRLFGGVTAWQLRGTAFLSMMAASLGLFLLLRKVYGFMPALVGAFSVSANAQIIRYAFDGRFYGPWLLLTVIYVWSLARRADGEGGTTGLIGICASAVALCLIHYFGIIALVLVSGGALLVAFPDRRRMGRILPGLASGGVTVLALLPMLRGQRAALSVPTWVPPASLLGTVWFLAPYLLLFVAAVVTRDSLRRHLRAGESSFERRTIVAGLLSLGLMPLLLVLFSFAVQSVMILRYALPGLLAMGVVVSALWARLAPGLRTAFALVLGLLGVSAATAQASAGHAFAQRVHHDSTIVREELRRGRIVISPSRKLLFPMWELMRETPDSLAMAIVPDARIRDHFPAASDSAGFGRYALLEQDMGRVYARLFGLPHQVSVDSLAGLPCFVLLEEQNAPSFVNRWMPEATATRLQEHVFLVHGEEHHLTGAPDHVCDDSTR